MAAAPTPQRPGSKNLETFYLLWLDASVNKTEENVEAQQYLRTSINYLETFENDKQSECYIQSLSSDDRVVLIVSGQLGQIIVPHIHSLRQLSSIYVRGVFVRLDELVSQITTDQTKRIHNKVDEALPICTFTAGAGQDQSTTEYGGNKAGLEILREFQQDYSPNHALWWYTRDSFAYRLLNKVLRVQNIDLLFLFRFFIRDLQQQFKDNQCTSRVCLYRRQLMPNDELQVSKDSTGSSTSNSIERVLFEITADLVAGVKSFANTRSFSYFPEEEEAFFMLGSIFRVINIQQDNEQVWLIQLKLCSENDNDLKSVIDEMKKDYTESGSETNLLSLGNILLSMNEYDSAEKYLFCFLDEQTNDHLDIARCYYLLGNLDTNTYHLDSSLT
ncbi:unnamed protein product [Rotaria magnacalcarata]|uniref:Uncharacterized protein n=1 Tax=Rotaria magnacalcarata TaxID=392030 RepID=A0A819Q1J6_9BILA|nr:unnamed protein product [Rotaria magnacalcarata]